MTENVGSDKTHSGKPLGPVFLLCSSFLILLIVQVLFFFLVAFSPKFWHMVWLYCSSFFVNYFVYFPPNKCFVVEVHISIVVSVVMLDDVWVC